MTVENYTAYNNIDTLASKESSCMDWNENNERIPLGTKT